MPHPVQHPLDLGSVEPGVAEGRGVDDEQREALKALAVCGRRRPGRRVDARPSVDELPAAEQRPAPQGAPRT
jgi:hypothetical protein